MQINCSERMNYIDEILKQGLENLLIFRQCSISEPYKMDRKNIHLKCTFFFII